MIQRQEKAQIPVDYQVIVTVWTGQSRLGLPAPRSSAAESFANWTEVPQSGQVPRPNSRKPDFMAQNGLIFFACWSSVAGMKKTPLGAWNGASGGDSLRGLSRRGAWFIIRTLPVRLSSEADWRSGQWPPGVPPALLPARWAMPGNPIAASAYLQPTTSHATCPSKSTLPTSAAS